MANILDSFLPGVNPNFNAVVSAMNGASGSFAKAGDSFSDLVKNRLADRNALMNYDLDSIKNAADNSMKLMANVEENRKNLANEDWKNRDLNETIRSHQADERYKQASLAETAAYHRGMIHNGAVENQLKAGYYKYLQNKENHKPVDYKDRVRGGQILVDRILSSLNNTVKTDDERLKRYQTIEYNELSPEEQKDFKMLSDDANFAGNNRKTYSAIKLLRQLGVDPTSVIRDPKSFSAKGLFNIVADTVARQTNTSVTDYKPSGDIVDMINIENKTLEDQLKKKEKNKEAQQWYKDITQLLSSGALNKATNTGKGFWTPGNNFDNTVSTAKWMAGIQKITGMSEDRLAPILYKAVKDNANDSWNWWNQDFDREGAERQLLAGLNAVRGEEGLPEDVVDKLKRFFKGESLSQIPYYNRQNNAVFNLPR